jgi:putative tryptophan/tyrosine transport system substrate-binding protein
VKRREFITLLGGAAAWPLAARAQQAGKLPTIGFLGADASSWSPWTAAFVERMRKLGWIEGRTPSQSSIAGMRDALSAAPRSQPSLSG